MVVFVVDDNPDDRALVMHQLKAALPDAVAREIGDAEELEDAFSREQPSCVITDLALGWTTGLDVLRRAKALYPACPVIMFTGAGDEDAAVEAMKAGLDDYVVKSPKRFARLQASIRDVVENAARKALVRQPEASPPEAAGNKKQPIYELHRRVHNQLTSVIDLLRTSAKQQSSTNISDRFNEVASRLTAITNTLDEFDNGSSPVPEGSGN
jgi:DNA-binding NtrC family response regulator